MIELHESYGYFLCFKMVGDEIYSTESDFYEYGDYGLIENII